MKKAMAFLLSVLLIISCVACNNSTTGSETESSVLPTESKELSSTENSAEITEKTTVNITVLKGPTGLGALQLMDKAENGTAANDYHFELASAPTDVTAKLLNKEMDIAAVPTNLAAVLYNKTKGNVVMLAANTLGTLYVVTKNADISTVADLKGKTIYSSGKGATPEYVLNFLLTENGLDPEKDVTVEYKSEHAEIAPLFASEDSVIAVLPEPFVTNMLLKNEGLKVSLNLTEAWNDVSESGLVMGCLVARKEFVDQNKEAVDRFLEEYKESTDYTNNQISAAAELSEKYGIMAKAVAEKAIPNCNITYLDGADMKSKVGGFFEVLFAADPASVGGSLPDDALYYEK